MTLIDLIKKAREEETTITKMAFEEWAYLDQSSQIALGQELCVLFDQELTNEIDLKFSLFTNQTHLFFDYFTSYIFEKIINNGVGEEIKLNEDFLDLLHFIVCTTNEDDFNENENGLIDWLESNTNCSIRNEKEIFNGDYESYVITNDLIELLKKVVELLSGE